MSTQKYSLMKMPENVKSDDITTGDGSLSKLKAFSTSVSVNWIITGSSIAGFSVIPDTTGFFGIPVTLAVVAGFVAVCQGFLFFMDEVPAEMLSELDNPNRKKSSREMSPTFTLKHEGVKLHSWTRSGGSGVAHLLLPLRIFKKVKMSESLAYFPYEDRYVKTTQYLKFGKSVKVVETFDGHRAVFNKAINSF